MRVTEPEWPKHAGPSGPAKQGPEPPVPDSATYNPPFGENANPRGLFSPEAMTSGPVWAAAGDRPAIVSAAAPSTAAIRYLISSTPRGPWPMCRLLESAHPARRWQEAVGVRAEPVGRGRPVRPG